jgi:hypothetical protein
MQRTPWSKQGAAGTHFMKKFKYLRQPDDGYQAGLHRAPCQFLPARSSMAVIVGPKSDSIHIWPHWDGSVRQNVGCGTDQRMARHELPSVCAVETDAVRPFFMQGVK